MKTSTTTHATAPFARCLAAVTAAVSVAALAGTVLAAGPSTASGGPNRDGLRSNNSPRPPKYGDLPVSPETIEKNLELWELREQIAQGVIRVPLNPPTRVRELPVVWAEIADQIPDGLGVMPRGFQSVNTWAGGDIPYTFSDEMINAFFFPDADPSDEDVNRTVGLANTLAAMLIIETEFRADPATGFPGIRFVGFDPLVHTDNRLLLVDSRSEDIWDTDGQIAEVCINSIDAFGSPQPELEGLLLTPNSAFNADVNAREWTHCTWTDFGSMVQFLGFALGLHLEHRRPDRDDFITVFPERIAPANFPTDQNDVFNRAEFFEIAAQGYISDTTDYDLDSITHADPLGASVDGRFVFEIRDDLRIRPDGRDRIDTVGRGDFFSDTDRIAIAQLYTDIAEEWYLGLEALCPCNVNLDDSQNQADFDAFQVLFDNGDPRAELNDDGVIDQDDFNIFQTIFLATGPRNCFDEPFDPTTGWFYGQNPSCPQDVNGDLVQNDEDVIAFEALFNAGSLRADLSPFRSPVDATQNGDGTLDESDLLVFDALFQPGVCNPTGPGVDREGWFLGKNPNCPVDVDENGIQNRRDVELFIELLNNGDPAADISPFVDITNPDANGDGFLNVFDIQTFNSLFVPGFCVDGVPPSPITRPELTDNRVNPRSTPAPAPTAPPAGTSTGGSGDDAGSFRGTPAAAPSPAPAAPKAERDASIRKTAPARAKP